MSFEDAFGLEDLKTNKSDAADGATPPPPPVAEGGKRKGQRKRGAEHLDSKSCFASACEALCLTGKRWCKRHNQLYDNMMYQAKKVGEAETLAAVMGDEEKAQKALDDFERESPCDGRYRRKALINWTQFQRVHGITTLRRDRAGARPFEQGQWMIHGEAVMGWSAAVTKAEWDKHKKNCQKDHLGVNGALRLWIPVIEETHIDKDRFVTNAVVESGAQEKKALMDQGHLDVLKNHMNLECEVPESVDIPSSANKELLAAKQENVSDEQQQKELTPEDSCAHEGFACLSRADGLSLCSVRLGLGVCPSV